MNSARWMQRLMAIALGFLLFITGCAAAPSTYDQVQEDTASSRVTAVETAAQSGGTFNKFFPASDSNYDVVPAQEKAGFAEYKLKQDGKTIAMLSINDTISLPAAAAKYDSASETVAGYPAVQQGTTTTGILVNGRYQVKVLSRDEGFTADDRAIWLQKFDLQGLAQLEASVKPAPQTEISPALEPEPEPAFGSPALQPAA